ncbi:2-hydroxyglutaryl-CoA dehydratase [Clostridium sp.]|uniref:2-hydroxyglutaryl-CoA dehydratase n=1 Tax=Clostridium sp. TaxID=1506 RepID=UPI0032174100
MNKDVKVTFTKEMSKDYTILMPMMAPIHFELIKNVFANSKYHVELLTNKGESVVQAGLKYVHNDTCYPALLVIGQMIDALNSGKYDVNKTALIITQTGGGCRASNYIFLLRKALKKAGYGQVPVISLNLSGMERGSGFKITLPMIHKILAAVIYGDVLMHLSNQVKPYEINKGESNDTINKWIEELTAQFKDNKGYSLKKIKSNMEEITQDFANVSINKTPKVKVGIVGEIYIKYASLGNNDLEAFLESQGCEVMIPGILGFIFYCTYERIDNIDRYGGSKVNKFLVKKFMNYLLKIEALTIAAVEENSTLIPIPSFLKTKDLVKDVVSLGNNMGEGWLLTAEMIELNELGYKNIICAQPFGCLPNHIVGKGMVRKIKNLHHEVNIVPIDYDPSATRVNQENRIKLMLAIARENLEGGENSIQHKDIETEKVVLSV